MSNKNISEINNEDISKIQNEIDNLEQKLFSDNNSTNINISLNELNSISESNNINLINLNSQNFLNKNPNEKINEKSFKFNNYNNNFKKIEEKKENENIKIIENDDIENTDNTPENFNKKQKIKELIELQKDIDKLRLERSKRINNKLSKMHTNKNIKNKDKNINKKK